jgi:predicted ATPase
VRPDLPTGPVTFLFTDVEGSTKLLHELGAEAYAEALAEHRRVIREACAAEGGVEVDTQGDAFFFAFPTAPGALAAASAFTEELESGRIQVRVGLHTGAPLLTDEGYVGDDVHFAARVAGSGHGGQVILSNATAELVELELIELGEHRLKDVPEAVAIFQLGDGSFPPLKTISNTNLPRPASSFVGREREMAEVVALLKDGARLLTLSGPGGSGKTRLSIEAAAELVPEFKAGVFWVGLATLRDPALVPATIAQTIGAKDGLAGHIGEREMLLLLDNLEQVIDAAPQLGSLLEACPNLRLLVTSRELLRVRGEVDYAVPPLAAHEAVALFRERSRLEADDTVTELCRHLDNLPLAVELAAARTAVLTPAQILERLSQRLDLLKGGRDSEARQQTLRATIEWSYRLLSADEQQVFGRLSVFAGGCTLEAAQNVAGADLDTLQSLVEKSLLRFTEGRYWMLETIRGYAAEKLGLAEQTASCRRRHARYFTALASEAATGLGEEEKHLDRLESERDNFRAAVSWWLQEDTATAITLVVDVSPLWVLRGPLEEGLRWLERAMDGSVEMTPHLRARALTWVARFNFRLGRADLALPAAEASLALYRELGDDTEIAGALEEVGEALSQVGEPNAARECLSEAYDLLRGHGTDVEIGRVLMTLGYLELAQANLAPAAELFEEGLERMRRTARPTQVAYALLNLGSARTALGQFDEAEAQLRESCALSRATKDALMYAYSVEALGILMGRVHRFTEAATLLGAANRMFEEHGAAMQAYELMVHEQMVPLLTDNLGAGPFSTAWARGASMTDGEVAAIVEPAAID